MKYKSAILVLLLFGNPATNEPEGWDIFKKVVFTPTYFEEIDSYFDVPTFNNELKALDGKTITLSGFYVSFDIDGAFILSGMPLSSCFFCGGAGPETVAEVRMKKIPDDLQIDDFIKVQGKLELNAKNIDHMNFIINEAKVIK
ncbi:hypothetical protein [Roseivirga misakiensis]|uniref:DUF3299 domain-containing protein n=1 Tax=Roseivirga misakiensis TaxID=1563681 RepID=A0A1E5SY16_9BACT|nr:hypothetical protein [Roseivirga misakiensis]OEK04018.1 hypothetical protein BFP71_11010 [Roseivirga misakiensis]